MIPTSRSVGEFLVTRKVLSRDALEEALVREAESGVPLAKILSSEGMVAERDLVAAVADQLGLPMWDPDSEPIPAILGGMLPVAMCQRLRAVAVGMSGNELTVAMENPTDHEAASQISEETGWVVRAVLAAASDISLAIEVLYGVEDAPPQVVSEGEEEVPRDTELHLNSLLVEMVQMGASDHPSELGAPSVCPNRREHPADGRIRGSDPFGTAAHGVRHLDPAPAGEIRE